MFLLIDSADFKRLERLCASSPDMFRKAVIASLRRSGAGMRKDLRQQMRRVSYLKGRDLTGAIGALRISGFEAEVRVSGSKKAAHKFRMVPSRITARKGRQSRSWPSPSVAIGPGEPLRQPQMAGYSRPFIAVTKSGLKAMYLREKGSGKLLAPQVASPQYFAAFTGVHEPVLKAAGDIFMKRLEHEIDYRLGLGK